MLASEVIWQALEGRAKVASLGLKALLVKGADAERFLGGQLTQDLSLVKSDQAKFSARLNNKGQIKSWQIIIREDRGFVLLTEANLLSHLKDDLDKFIIMDDVELEEIQEEYVAILGQSQALNGPWLSALSAPIKIIKKDSIREDLVMLDPEVLKQLKLLGAWPTWQESIKPDALVNETIFETNGVSYQKGCFLGQETAAKIHTRRGASYAPALLVGHDRLEKGSFEALGRKAGEVIESFQYQGDWIHLIQIFREFRVDNLELEVGSENFVVHTQSANFSIDLEGWSQRLYDRATDLFKTGNEEESLSLLKLALELNPGFADAYEVLGVILGRHERYLEAIEYMDKLSLCDPTSVMAHTNKSLYLMKIGKITEAEEEKSKATVKTFEKLGRDAATKRELEAKEQADKVERERRRAMFDQVLEIDPEDEIALYGLGDLSLADKEFEKSLAYFERVLSSNPKHSRSYLMAGRACEGLSRNEQAIEFYRKGMDVATKAGELMPATEMRSRLVALTR